MTDIAPGGRFAVSDRVQKARGYKYPGVVVSRFLTLSGQVRYVVEALHPDFKGMLHIFSDEQLELAGAIAPPEPAKSP